MNGIDLRDLEDFDGLPKNAASRAGHPSDDYQPNHALAMALAERFDLPVRWFEDEDWQPPTPSATPDAELHELVQQVLDQQVALGAKLDSVLDEQERLRTLQERGGPKVAGSGK